MGSYIVQEFSIVHDNEITAYQVDIKNHFLLFETLYNDKEKTEIIFSGLMAHQFTNVTYSNIIFNITQVTIDYYIESNREALEQSIRYAFPAFFESIEALRQSLEEESTMYTRYPLH